MAAPAAAAEHAQRVQQASAALAAQPAGAPPRLAKASSNLFRDRAGGARTRLDLRAFDHVLAVDAAAGWVDAEGGTSFEALVAATLPHGLMPAVVPQLKTITVGGAVAGVGIEATSFRHGLVHHAVRELDVLLPDGRVVTCAPEGEHADLFHALPNSYGTLGYVLRARMATQRVLRFVSVRHLAFDDAARAIDALARCCDDPALDFVDAVAFDDGAIVICAARFVDTAPAVSEYGVEQIYWRSLRTRDTDHLRVLDYLWRWDTDWFWCSANFGLQRPWLRRLVGRERLNSRTYTRWMRTASRWRVAERWARLRGRTRESVIQDVDIPLAQAAEFLAFLRREIGIAPIWLCPLRAPRGGFVLYPLREHALYLNFGFWAAIESAEPHERGHFNRLIEREVMRLGGIKSLYSDSYFTREEFDRAYGREAYAAAKARYDPQHRALDLYDKCVLRA
ncbi:MAG: FAD-binding oxidoreductase [Burkholderiaceae bacterium]